MNKIIKNQSGQVLPFFIVAGTVLLAVIANLSLRNISSGFRSTTLDTASRVTAAAEGGLERFLSYSYSELAAKANVCNGGEVPGCVVAFGGATSDYISAQATVEVRPYGNGNSLDFSLDPGQTYEVNLDNGGAWDFYDGKLYLCWDGDTDVYFIAYYSNGTSLTKGYVCDVDGDCDGGLGSGSTVEDPDNNQSHCTGFDHQYKIKNLGISGTNIKGLRIRTVGTDETVDAGIRVTNGNLPIQGYEIISTGQISQAGDVQSQVVDTKAVEVSYPFLPAYFDFGIFSEGGF